MAPTSTPDGLVGCEIASCDSRHSGDTVNPTSCSGEGHVAGKHWPFFGEDCGILYGNGTLRTGGQKTRQKGGSASAVVVFILLSPNT